MSRWACICRDCNEEIEPELDEATRYNTSGTEITYWVPVCPECGWQLSDDQSQDWFAHQQQEGN